MTESKNCPLAVTSLFSPFFLAILVLGKLLLSCLNRMHCMKHVSTVCQLSFGRSKAHGDAFACNHVSRAQTGVLELLRESCTTTCDIERNGLVRIEGMQGNGWIVMQRKYSRKQKKHNIGVFLEVTQAFQYCSLQS